MSTAAASPAFMCKLKDRKEVKRARAVRASNCVTDSL
jgi:hypothetical protein